MATNPVVQAAAEVLARDMNASMDWHRWLPEAEAVVVAVAPLIRRQAFNEAAEKLEAERENPKNHYIRGSLGFAAALVRGLGEKENA